MDLSVLDFAARKKICFYSYRLPYQRVRFGACLRSDCIRGMAEGFVIQPFNPAEEAITIPSLITDVESVMVQREKDSSIFPYYDTSKGFYMKHSAQIIDYLRQNPEQKVVYSKVLVRDFKKKLSSTFQHLCELYPHAYVFCFFTPQTGLWIGASPELLGKSNSNRFSTMALAGTMDAHCAGRWSDKNMREQRVVVDSIRSTLRNAGIENIRERYGQRVAGPVKHLITEFEAEFNAHFPADELARQLSPTPALAGWPRSVALEMIAAHEAHTRGCYGGFCGPRYTARDFMFWVNLRSMQIRESQCALYVGGGLMSDSNPEEEWTETERKAATMEAVL